MKKLLIALIIGLSLVTSALVAPKANANYYNYPASNTQFHPMDPNYYNGNKRLELKERADIERAAADNVHYDKYDQDYYRCNWIYNKNLETWVCEEAPSTYKSQPVTVCPYGYRLDTGFDRCEKVGLPSNSHLNAQGNGSECNAGFVWNGSSCIYAGAQTISNPPVQQTVVSQPQPVAVTQYITFYDDTEVQISPAVTGVPKPNRLPSTGSPLALSALIAGAVGLILRRKLR